MLIRNKGTKKIYNVDNAEFDKMPQRYKRRFDIIDLDNSSVKHLAVSSLVKPETAKQIVKPEQKVESNKIKKPKAGESGEPLI
jgi:hypothetical protein